MPLRAEKRFDTEATTDAEARFEPPLGFAIPSELLVAEGNAGIGELTFQFQPEQGGLVTCSFSGATSEDGVEAPGDRYLLRSCEGSYRAGQRVSATFVKVRVLDGDHVRVVSRRGIVAGPAKVGTIVPPGVVFVQFHYGELGEEHAANNLTPAAWDPVSKQPVQKAAAVRLERMEGTTMRAWWQSEEAP